MDDLIKISGKVTHIVFRNDETFYTVLRFKLNDETEKNIVVTGIMPSVEKDILYNLYGTYVEHPRYGMQFSLSSYEKPLPNEEEGIVRYLSGVQFPGIGKKTAEKIARAMGADCIARIKENPDCLIDIPDLNLSAEKLQVIKDGLAQEDSGMEDLVRFLNVHGIGIRNLIRLNRAYGKDALAKLRENPYRVIDECDGFGFKTADKIAFSIGFQADDPRRLYALLVSLCMDLCMRTGDSFISAETLEHAFEEECGDLSYDYENLLDQACMNRRIVIEEGRIYPVTQYDAETGISGFLAGFPYEDLDPCDENLLEEYLKSMQADIGITYDELQVEAIHSFFRNDFLILTGGPGTGKTTVVRAMVQMFRLLYPSATIVCAAPTGRAAKRLSELTETNTQTIHSLLQWDLETNTFGKNKEEPVLADLLIVDEFSMVDSWLFHNLLLACEHVKKICIIGDEDQLPSVSPGSVLRDLIDAKRFPLVRLSHVYRQKEGSDVIELAHQIHHGFADFSILKNDVAFLECSRYEIKDQVLRIVQNALEKGYAMNDIQVLSCKYSGVSGIDILNNALQECFNPQDPLKKEIRIDYKVLRTGDKILQLKNQPDDDVYNGDIGILEEIYDASETENHQPLVVVNFDGIMVEYSPDTFQNITLAYCVSVHKSQGSEYPIVILPVSYEAGRMLQRKLLYTGVTRARQSLVLLGEKDAFLKGIETLDRHPRQTTLCQRILNAPERNGIPE
jgi:exodeoxyribonuclease V alpha subunit